MNTIRMNQFGRTLTDRADGKKAFNAIVSRKPSLMSLDFSGVVSLGSSFGEEVIPGIAAQQNNHLTIINANDVIKNSVRRIIEGTSVQISFENG